jgi:hypothetical protein
MNEWINIAPLAGLSRCPEHLAVYQMPLTSIFRSWLMTLTLKLCFRVSCNSCIFDSNRDRTFSVLPYFGIRCARIS